MTWRFLLALFAVLLVAQALLYVESFGVKPVDDDFSAPLEEIWRGQAEGPSAFFERSMQPHNYRPLQSLAMYLFGSIDEQNRELWLRVMAFVGMAVFALAAMLWIRAAPISRRAAIIAAAALFVHPALVAPLAGIDGYSTLYSTGLMWMSAYAIFACRDRLILGVPIALAIFTLAMGFKEYSLGAVPLACLVPLCFQTRLKRGLLHALIVGAAFCIVVLAMIQLRRHTIPPPPPGTDVEYLLFSPATWIKNAALFGGVLLFPGSTTWVFTNYRAMVLGVVAAVVLAIACAMFIGLSARWRGDHAIDRGSLDRMPQSPVGGGAKRWIVFSVLAIPAASFPAVLVFHVSEMYAAGMVIAIALLVALAADGFASLSRPWRVAGTVVLLGAVVWGAAAVRAKVHDLRSAGELAELQLRQIAALLPESAHDVTVAVIYPPHDQPPVKYSVFIVPDDVVASRERAMNWLMPHRNIRLIFPQDGDGEASSVEPHDLVVRWNRSRQMMEPLPQMPGDLPPQPN